MKSHSDPKAIMAASKKADKRLDGAGKSAANHGAWVGGTIVQ